MGKGNSEHRGSSARVLQSLRGGESPSGGAAGSGGGHGLRERQVRGPARPLGQPETAVIRIRRYRCRLCGGLTTVLPRGLTARRHYSASAIGLSLSVAKRAGASSAALVMVLSSLPVNALAAPGNSPPPAAVAASSAVAPSAVERAREAFRRGAELAKTAHWQEAIASFEISRTVRLHPVTSYNVGFCELALGHATRARKAFKRALAEHRGGDGPLPDALLQQAERYLDELERTVARLDVQVDSARAALSVDGQPVERDVDAKPSALPVVVAGTSAPGAAEIVPGTQFQLIVDPGTHRLLFSYPDREGSLVVQTLAAGARVALTQTALPASRIHASRMRVGPSHAPRPTWAYLSLAVGAAGIATGSVAGALALSKKSTLDKECGPSRMACPAPGDIHALKTYADTSSVGFAVGALGLGVGLGLVLWGTDVSSKSASVTRRGSSAAGRHNPGVQLELDIRSNQLGLSGEF